ncbi:hypothetical protein ACFV2D_37690 [Streptomyces capillispiralis]|uniref:hypothetical protein n=1 Tax=Streptomyces capillispiralis TaxID=68182 RepID=UPI00367C0668
MWANPTNLLGGGTYTVTGLFPALGGGHHARSVPPAGTDGEADELALAAVRVLGSDALLPALLLRTPPDPAEVAVFRKAVEAYPPRADAAPTVRWSHWGMARALRHADPSFTGPPEEPGTGWLDEADWQFLTHQLAVLAPLALPGEDCALGRLAGRRPVDVARGFVRAVRRRDWRQAAGAGRWLTLLSGVPDTVGLEAGLDFVELMGGQDPLVALHVQAARQMRAGAPV